MSIYIFEDPHGNKLVWKSSDKEVNQGDTLALVGTIKNHEEYKSEKQTVLTRCKIVSVTKAP